MPFNLKKLFERRVELMTQLENLVKTCETETRAFNEEEQKQYSDILAEVRSIDATLDAADQGAALQRVERRAAGGQKENPSQEEMETRAFECYIRGVSADVETRAAVNMTVGDNGAVIPTSIANKIIEMVKEISPLYQLATHYDVGGTLTIPSYDESTQKITMAYATEFTALTSSSGKFTSISLGGFLAGALTKVSMSLVNNSKFDIVSYVIRKMAEAVAEWIENELINGTASKIEGLSKVTASVTAAAATAITSDELIDLQESIPDALQANCIWVMSRATRKAIRKLKDGDGNYLLNKDATSKWGYSLFGHDVYVSQSMPDMAAGKRAVLYLDPTGLAVKISEEPSVQVLREKFADEHAVGVICWMEVDSKVENKQKVAVLAMGAGA
ncbi:phage major capsid protein [Flavonifractor plautii]|uniref:phage major capsid protein n=1 Tax=Flavonifractor plautii TaxID=292800 RepID=UPI003DA4D7E2